jgi:hypothetical protein
MNEYMLKQTTFGTRTVTLTKPVIPTAVICISFYENVYGIIPVAITAWRVQVSLRLVINLEETHET